MKIWQKISQSIENLLASPVKEMGHWARLMRFQIELWKYCYRQLRQHNAMAMSSALSFRTLFALIPTLVLALLIVKAVMPTEDSQAWLDKALHAANFDKMVIVTDSTDIDSSNNLSNPTPNPSNNAQQPSIDESTANDTDVIPDSDPNTESSEGSTQELPPNAISMADEISKLVRKIEQKLTLRTIGPIGVVLLIWSAITLLTTMERSLNRIYGARQSRGLARRITLYWSVLTLGPILLVTAGYIEVKLTDPIHTMPVLSWLLNALGWAGPICVGIILLAALYKTMPNTTVSFKSAVGGSLVVVPLWLVAKWGFTMYVTSVGSSSLYGALGLIPIFLLWVNLSWTIFLFGAELAHTAANLDTMQMEDLAAQIHLGPNDLLAAAVVVGREYQACNGPVPFKKIAETLNLPDDSVYSLLERLITNKVICPVQDEETDQFILARPADKVSVIEVMEIDNTERSRTDAQLYHDEMHDIIQHVKDKTREHLGDYSLAQVMNEGAPYVLRKDAAAAETA